jgi:hypothetical protein
MAAFNQHPGYLHERLARLWVVGLGFDETRELAASQFEQLPSPREVTGLCRFVDLRSTFLIIENRLQFGRQARVGSQQVNELECKVMKSTITQLLKKPLGGSWILRRLPCTSGSQYSQECSKQNPDQHSTAARHEGLLRLPEPAEKAGTI